MLFAGTSDSNLNFIEKKFDAKIILRGDEIHLDGNESELSRVEKLISDMISTINFKGYIENDDLDTLFFSSSDLHKNQDKNSMEEIILYTHKGAVVAQTAGQKKYYKAVLDNDIVFSYGPSYFYNYLLGL